MDHPENVQVNPDERFLDDPPFASGRVVASESARLPSGAWDGDGRDVLDELSRRDHKFVSGFTPSPYDGFANLHTLTLDLGEVKTGVPASPFDDGLRELFQRDFALRCMASGCKANFSVCRSGIA